VIVQVQVGCRYRCDGTVQVQTAIQIAQTTQAAVAAGATGAAVNVSIVEQYVWQVQLGCVAFCSGTSQTQSVVQLAATTQTAAGTAIAVNASATLQQIVQRQEGCRAACAGVVQQQTGEQGAITRQTATAYATGPPPRSPFQELDEWMASLAADTGVTIQVVRQLQLADCLRDCVAASHGQTALQHALTVQQAVAEAGRPA
jgi:hypothetical protein